MGNTFVVFGSEEDQERFMNYVFDAIETPTSRDDIPATITKINSDHFVSHPVGRSRKLVEFNRYRVYFSDLPEDTYLEIVCFNSENYMTNEWEVGEFDVREQNYTGRAHKLYDLTRNVSVARYFFPHEIYGIDINELVVQKRHEIADDLLYGSRIIG